MSSGEPGSSKILTADGVGQRFQPVSDPDWSADFRIGPARRMQIHFKPRNMPTTRTIFKASCPKPLPLPARERIAKFLPWSRLCRRIRKTRLHQAGNNSTLARYVPLATIRSRVRTIRRRQFSSVSRRPGSTGLGDTNATWTKCQEFRYKTFGWIFRLCKVKVQNGWNTAHKSRINSSKELSNLLQMKIRLSRMSSAVLAQRLPLSKNLAGVGLFPISAIPASLRLNHPAFIK